MMETQRDAPSDLLVVGYAGAELYQQRLATSGAVGLQPRTAERLPVSWRSLGQPNHATSGAEGGVWLTYMAEGATAWLLAIEAHEAGYQQLVEVPEGNERP